MGLLLSTTKFELKSKQELELTLKVNGLFYNLFKEWRLLIGLEQK